MEHEYEPDTNVLARTFTTAEGVVRVTDAMLLPDRGLAPARELARRVEGLAGDVTMRWEVEPRFDYGRRPGSIGVRSGVPVATSGRLALAVPNWNAGEPRCDRETISGRFELAAGDTALLALAAADQEPLVLPARDQVERRVETTRRFWREWAAARTYLGPWRVAVVRSALALKLLMHAPSGAIAAAATASLPEQIGGERNWDYRFCWVRDAAFTLPGLLNLGCPREADAFLWWLLHASQLTHPRLQVLYRLDGRQDAAERTLPLPGYADSRPVRVGNEASGQLQLDVYGDFIQTAWLCQRAGGRLDTDTARRLAETADLVARIWRQPDSGIWEVRSEPTHFTHSKMMCWVALDRAAKLAQAGHIPDRHAARWRSEAHAIREFVDRRCWSERLGSYVRFADGEELDASLCWRPYSATTTPASRGCSRLSMRSAASLDTDLCCTATPVRTDSAAARDRSSAAFWLVEAMARAGRVDEAAALMDELIGLANEVGLYSEEIDPESGAFLGNMPQGLVHLALIGAAAAIQAASA